MKRTRALLNATQPVTPEAYFQALCQDAAADLDADKTSVWTFDADLTQIECQCGYDALTQTFSRGQILRREDYPRYFKTIVEDSIVCAPEANSQAVTAEFVEAYFRPNGIVSLLDFILHEGTRPYGIICCENRRGIRNWSVADQNYLRSLASLTSFLFLPRTR